MCSYWDWQICLREPQTPLTIFKLVALLIWLVQQQQQQQHIKRYVRSRTHATRHILIWNAERTASLAPGVVNQKNPSPPAQPLAVNIAKQSLVHSRIYVLGAIPCFGGELRTALWMLRGMSAAAANRGGVGRAGVRARACVCCATADRVYSIT